MSELNSVHQHYEQLLADHYEWMFAAPVDELVARQKRALRDAGIEERPGGLALDLGCGSGFQSLALQELGYEVLALDNSEKLLAKLARRAGAAGITTRLADIRRLDDLVARESFHVAVCMGDTLTHLPHREDVSGLFRAVARALAPRGRFVLSYRDLAATERLGLERFIPVHGDAERVMTCFLEYDQAESVRVTDLIHTRSGSGEWSLNKSSYRKLRLAADWVGEALLTAGLAPSLRRNGELCTVVADKPAP